MLIQLFIISAQFSKLCSVPGGTFAKAVSLTLHEFYLDMRFVLSHCGGIQHTVLDNHYVEYFGQDLSNEIGTKQKIAIYTHLYMLFWKAQQNRAILEKMFCQQQAETDEGKATSKISNKRKKNMFKRIRDDLREVQFSAQRKGYGAEMRPNEYYTILLCQLMQIKHQLFRALSAEQNDETAKNGPTCNNLRESMAVVNTNREQILEWMLSDMMHFFPRREKLVKFFEEAAERNDDAELQKILTKFANLFGIPRMAMICNFYKEKLGIYPFVGTPFYTHLYKQYFWDRTKLGRWRTKIIIDKFLYDEWAHKIFEGEFVKIMTESGEGDEVRRTRAILADELVNCWQFYSRVFWFRDKIIRARIDQFARESKGKTDKMRELIEQQFNEQLKEEKDLLLLWENGPEDMTLLRAVAFCTEEFVAKIKRIDAIESQRSKLKQLKTFSGTFVLKFFMCLADNLKQMKRDKFLTKMHFDKIAQIIGEQSDEEGHTFRKMMFANNEENLKRLIGADEIRQLKQKLAEENNFFPTNENFNSSTDEEEENFADAFENFNAKNEGDERDKAENSDGNTKSEGEKLEGEKRKEIKGKEGKMNKKEKRKEMKRKKEEKEKGQSDGVKNEANCETISNKAEEEEEEEEEADGRENSDEIKMTKKMTKYFIKQKRNFRKSQTIAKDRGETEQKSEKGNEQNLSAADNLKNSPAAKSQKQSAENGRNLAYNLTTKYKINGEKGSSTKNDANLSAICENREKSAESDGDDLAFYGRGGNDMDYFEFRVKKISKFTDDNFLRAMYEQMIDLMIRGKSGKVAKIGNPKVKSLVRVLDIGAYVNEIYHRVKAMRRQKEICEKNHLKLSTSEAFGDFDDILRTISESDLSKGTDAKHSSLIQRLHLGLRRLANGGGKIGDELAEEIGAVTDQIHCRKVATFVVDGQQKRAPFIWEQTDEIRKKQFLETIKKLGEKEGKDEEENGGSDEKSGKKLLENFEKLKNMYETAEVQRKIDENLLDEYQNNNFLRHFVEEGIREKFSLAKIEKIPKDLQEIKFNQKQLKEKILLSNLKANGFVENNEQFYKAVKELQLTIEKWSSEAKLQVMALLVKSNSESFNSLCVLPDNFKRAEIFGNFICDFKMREGCQDESLLCIFCNNFNVSFVQKWEKNAVSLVLKVTLMDVQMDIHFVAIPKLKHLPIGNYNSKQIRRMSTILVESIENLLKSDNFDDVQYHFESKKLIEIQNKNTNELLKASGEKAVKIKEDIEKTKMIKAFLEKSRKKALEEREKANEMKEMLSVLMDYGNDLKVLEFILSDDNIFNEDIAKISQIDNLKIFLQALAYLEMWATGNYIHSAEMGYLNSKMLRVMLAKVSLMYPNSSILFIIEKFFYTFSTWHWPLPVQLEQQVISEQNGELMAMAWAPGREWAIRKQNLASKRLRKRAKPRLTMPIIGPMFPQQNFGQKINALTAKVIQQKMREALVQHLSAEHLAPIAEALNPVKFISMYDHFVAIFCAGPQFIIEKFCAFVGNILSEELPSFINGIAGDFVDYLHLYPKNLNVMENKNANFEENKRTSAHASYQNRLWLVGIRSNGKSQKQKSAKIFWEKINENFRNNFDASIENDFNAEFNFYSVQLNSKIVCRNELAKLGITIRL